MGADLNLAWDKRPFQPMYEMARIAGRLIAFGPDEEWDFSELIAGPIPRIVSDLLDQFTSDLRGHKWVGWKLPETCFVYPWLVRLIPQAFFIHWVRDPRDVIRSSHNSDDLRYWGVKGKSNGTIWEQRANSWKLQFDIVDKTPLPKHFVRLRLEDLVEFPEKMSTNLEEYLGAKIHLVEGVHGAIGRWRRNPDEYEYPPWMRHYLQLLGYPLV